MDAAGSQEELAVTEQVMVECRVLTVPDDLVDAWSRDERAVFALEVPSGAAEPLYDAEGVESLTAPRIVLNSGARGAIATHDQHAFVEAFHEPGVVYSLFPLITKIDSDVWKLLFSTSVFEDARVASPFKCVPTRSIVSRFRKKKTRAPVWDFKR